MDMYQELGGTFNEASDDQVVAAIKYLALDWFKIFNRYNNNPPAPRVVTYSSGSEYITWYVYPAFYNDRWIIGYALECTIEGGAGSTYQHMHEVNDNTCINAIPSDIIWRNVGLPYGKMLSSYHIILEANEVYEKHWFDVGPLHGVIIEFAKTNLSVDKWILIRVKQISLVNNIPEVIIRVPNDTSKADITYDSQVQQIRESTGKPTNITTFLANYMKTEY